MVHLLLNRQILSKYYVLHVCRQAIANESKIFKRKKNYSRKYRLLSNKHMYTQHKRANVNRNIFSFMEKKVVQIYNRFALFGFFSNSHLKCHEKLVMNKSTECVITTRTTTATTTTAANCNCQPINRTNCVRTFCFLFVVFFLFSFIYLLFICLILAARVFRSIYLARASSICIFY